MPQLSLEASVTLTARVGIHLGEVILLRNLPADIARGAKPLEVEGIAKPTAARLMSLAERAREDLGDKHTKRKGKGVRPVGRVD